MSGGSMNYFYANLDEVSFLLTTPERRAFYAHLKKVANALHDIEWVDSHDYENGRETKAIMACITPSDVLTTEIERAISVRYDLEVALAKAKKAAKND